MLANILSQHLEDAALLYVQRADALTAAHYRLDDLRTLERRLAAHLDGISVAGEEGWALCLKELARWQEPGEVFAATVTSLHRNGAIEEKIITAAKKTAECTEALITALEWCEFAKVAPFVNAGLTSDDSFLQRASVAALCRHRHLLSDDVLRSLLQSSDEESVHQALEAIGELGRAHLADDVALHLKADSSSVRYAAAVSLLRFRRDEEALEIVRRESSARSEVDRYGLALMIGRCEPAEVVAWIEEIATDDRSARLAIIAAGVLGTPEIVERLFDGMMQDHLARVAAESFSLLTGVDLARDGLEWRGPSDDEAGPNDDPRDEKVAIDADQYLPWPDVAKLRAWWSANGSRFSSGIRTLLGREVTDDSFLDALRNGFQRQRIVAAAHLALRHPQSPRFPFTTLARRQLRRLDEP